MKSNHYKYFTIIKCMHSLVQKMNAVFCIDIKLKKYTLPTITSSTKAIPSFKISNYILVVLFLLVTGTGSLRGATTYIWTGGTSTSWANPANWNPNTGYPGLATNDIAQIGVISFSGFQPTLSVTPPNALASITLGTAKNATLTVFATYTTGLLTIGAGSAVTESGSITPTFTGGITNNGTYTASTGVHTFSTNAQVLTGTLSIPKMTINVGNTNNGTLTCSTLLTITGATLTNTGIINSSTSLTGTGTLSNTSGTVNITAGSCSVSTNTNGGIFAISGTATSTTSVANFTNNGTLNISGSGTVTGITNGTGGIVNHSGSSTVTSFNNSTSTSTLNISTTPIVPTFSTLTVSAPGNMVNYNGAGNQNVKVVTYSNLILSGSGTKTCTVNSVTNDFTLNGTATVSHGANLIVGRDLILNGGTFTTGAFSLGVTRNLVLNGGNLTLSGALNFGVNGATTVISGTLSVPVSAGNKSFTGVVTLNGGTMTGASTTLVFGAGITNAGGTVSLSGSATISTSGAILGGANPISISSLTMTSPGILSNNGTLTCATLLKITGGTLTNTGTINSSTSLTGTGTMSNTSGTVNIAAGTCSISTITNGGIFAISGSATCTTIVSNFTNTGTINISGSGVIAGITNGTGGIVNHSGSSTITSFNNSASTSTLNISTTPVVPTFTVLTVTVAGNTVNYNGAGNQTIKIAAYSNLTLSGSGAKTCAVNSVTNDLTLSGNATITYGAALTVGRDLILNGGTFTTGAFTLGITRNLVLSGGNLTTTGSYAFGVSGTSTINNGTLTVPVSAGNKTFTGLITLNGGTMTGASTTLVLGTGITNAGGIIALTGTVTMPTAGAIFNGANPITIATLTVGSPGTVTNSGTVILSNALSGSGTFINGDGASGTLSIGGTCGITTLTTNAPNNTVKYTGTGQTILALNYYNLDLSGSATPFPLSGSYSFAGAFSPRSTISPAQGTSTIIFTGTGQTIPAFTYNNLIISGSITPVLVNGGTITIAGVFTCGIVVPTFTNNTMAFTGTGQTIPAFTYNNLILNGTGIATVAGTATVNGNLNIIGYTLSINPAVALSVSGTITTDGNVNSIYIHSSPSSVNGSLIFHNTAGSPVSATVEMYSKAAALSAGPSNYQWQFFGIPVSKVTASPTFDKSWVRQYDETSMGSGSNGKWNQLSNLSVLSPFTGYEITQDIAKTIVFQGQLVNKDTTITLHSTAGVPYEGQHVLSNPYTAAIDIREITFGPSTEATVYLYNTGSQQDWNTNTGGSTYSTSTTTSGQYIAIPQSSIGTGTIPYDIPSMSGFLVKSTSEIVDGSLLIPYNSVTNNVHLQRVKQSNTTASVRTYLEISVKSEHSADCVWLINQPGTTRGFDNGWDGYKISGSTGTPQLYASENGKNFQVSTSEDFSNTYLGFQHGEDLEYTLTFKNENLGNYYSNLYLLDILENKTIDITSDSTQYHFTSEASNKLINRFKIVSVPKEKDKLNTSTELNIFNSQNTIYINNLSNRNGEMVVFDIIGHVLKRAALNPLGITVIQLDNIKGVCVVNAAISNEKVSKRIILGE